MDLDDLREEWGIFMLITCINEAYLSPWTRGFKPPVFAGGAVHTWLSLPLSAFCSRWGGHQSPQRKRMPAFSLREEREGTPGHT